MRVSEFFTLGVTQPSLDFVDVDVVCDLPVFVDPRALRLLPSNWGRDCVGLVHNFFQKVLGSIRLGNDSEGRQLLRTLREPNETHLGFSRGRSRGRALGRQSSDDVWKALASSQAVHSGLIEDLEDTILMVDGIGDDIVSDITTNLIRPALIEYTQAVCNTYRIPLTSGVDSGPLWDPAQQAWHNEFTSLPVVDHRKLLLVPKVVVRRKMDYSASEYYNDYILQHLSNIELSANTELVRMAKHGRRWVAKKDLADKYGRGKAVIVRETLNHPELLRRYRDQKNMHVRPPLGHIEIADEAGSSPPNWDALLEAVTALPTGTDEAASYQRAVESLLSALFYPALADPQPEHKIHDGRKRIDITYTNVATQGFFYWIAANYRAPYIFVECKNYGTELGNPELDQLAGRFSPDRGKFGVLVCRTFEDKRLFVQRCRDTAQDDRGYIVALDDSDLKLLVEARRQNDHAIQFQFLQERFQELVM